MTKQKRCGSQLSSNFGQLNKCYTFSSLLCTGDKTLSKHHWIAATDSQRMWSSRMLLTLSCCNNYGLVNAYFLGNWSVWIDLGKWYTLMTEKSSTIHLDHDYAFVHISDWPNARYLVITSSRTIQHIVQKPEHHDPRSTTSWGVPISFTWWLRYFDVLKYGTIISSGYYIVDILDVLAEPANTISIALAHDHRAHEHFDGSNAFEWNLAFASCLV